MPGSWLGSGLGPSGVDHDASVEIEGMNKRVIILFISKISYQDKHVNGLLRRHLKRLHYK